MKGYPTIFNNIIFIESTFEDGQKVSPVSADLSFSIGAQLKNLNDVKSDIAKKVMSLHCNCVSEFKYGQKSRWLAIDDVAYFGNGIAMKISEETYQKIVDYIKQRDS